MNVNNEELKIISLCDDLVEDLVYAEPEIVEGQNDVDLPKNDLNQSFASIWPLEPCLDMAFNNSKDASSCMLQCICKEKGFIIQKNHKRLSKEDKSLVRMEYGFVIKVVKIKKEKVHNLQKLEWDAK
ncbi:hypothetical protein CFP56_038569 [Quercus suber]|uniref:Uncharacterized protein n=1 Tax=Quercus suber TaxID=58331 RepID=A0AAW0LM81_QUESU